MPNAAGACRSLFGLVRAAYRDKNMCVVTLHTPIFDRCLQTAAFGKEKKRN